MKSSKGSPPAPWWRTLEEWDLIQSDRAKLLSRARHINGKPSLRHQLVRDLLSNYPEDPVVPHTIYDDGLQAARAPLLYTCGIDRVGTLISAAAISFETIVVMDPISLVRFIWSSWATDDDVDWSLERTEDLCSCTAIWFIVSQIAEIIPLVQEGLIRFDGGLGTYADTKQLWEQLPIPVARDLADHGKDHSEVVDTFWAAARAQRFGGAVGTATEANASVLRRICDNYGGPGGPTRSVEIEMLLPRLDRLEVPDALALRKRHGGSLAQFRTALRTMMSELRNLKSDDLNEVRVRQVVNDYIDGELAKLDREWKSVKSFRYGSVAAASVVLGAAAFGVYGGSVSSLPATVGLLSAGVLGLANAMGGLASDRARLSSNGVYLLWKAARPGRRHRRAARPLNFGDWVAPLARYESVATRVATATENRRLWRTISGLKRRFRA